MADGRAKVIVGTHAILSEDLRHDDLALVIVDEEQRFGSEQKAVMRSLAEGVHVLSMTATPIPRTLQAGFVGLNDLSIIATPPNRRSPVRTRTGPFDAATVRDALVAEHGRKGQSFVVCPRIEDLKPMAEMLQELVPDQSVVTLHGKMKADEVEDAMLAFGQGEHDILLATAIVESGLDVANANTMIVCHSDRFGLAELHQLRGRVGRGSRRGHVLLTTEAGREIGDNARARLTALAEFSTLGSGFDIAARDLDLRGTGELLGDEQAGHIQTIGIGLYRKTLERAISLASGELETDDIRPTISLGLSAAIPIDYVPETDMRIELALLLERVADMETLDDLRREVEDRFGPMPPSLQTHFELAELRLRCRELGVTKLDHGPKATALSFTPTLTRMLDAANVKDGKDMKWSKGRLVFAATESEGDDPLRQANEVLDRVAVILPAGNAAS
jgi:transcription-repair coupling factor (superfamily II helicase)